MKNKRRKEQLIVRRAIRKANKQLREDKFAGRFEIKQVGRIDKLFNNWTNYCPKVLKADEIGDPCWLVNYYLIDLIDNEAPERTCHLRCRFSPTFGLYDTCALDENASLYTRGNYGVSQLGSVLNEFIIQSDFDEKWKTLEYAKTHWYSGDELEETLKILGPEWVSAETLAKARPDRFK